MADFNALEYNTRLAKGIFRNVYPAVAARILERTGVKAGQCLDLGGGSGMLGIRLAEITDLHVTIYDPNAESIQIALENAAEYGVRDKVSVREGTVERISFPDASIDLVASRGSIFFWQDQALGLREAYRVLKPGGWAYIGGGMGNAEVAAEVAAAWAKDSDLHEPACRKFPPGHFTRLLDEVGITGTVDAGPGGIWIIFQKQAA